MSAPVVIVGAGLAGLACARRLVQVGHRCHVIEAGSAVGGRVRTDVVNGYRLDRGFQIYLTAYPEGKRVLDYDALNLKPFVAGAKVYYGSKFHRVADPRREPLTALRSLAGPVGSFADKARLARLKLSLDLTMGRDFEPPESSPDVTTQEYLSQRFSPKLVERLFRPFLGGVFLEHELHTSSRFFEFIYTTFARGPGAVPALGMQRIPEQLAAQCHGTEISLDTPVARIGPGAVTLASGETVECRAVVVATDGSTADALLNESPPERPWNHNVTYWFAAPTSPTSEPILCLNGEGLSGGPVNTAVTMSDASPDYAPPGRSLVAVALIPGVTLADAELTPQVLAQCERWFGPQVKRWELLRIDRIPRGLPGQPPGTLTPWRREVRVRPGLYRCGDYLDNASIDGALVSGFRAAQAAAEDLHALRC